jgi:16S rRNA processing protein RimM
MTEQESSLPVRQTGPPSAEPLIPEDRLVGVGLIARPHGLKGEIRLLPEPDVDRVLAAVEVFYARGPRGLIPLRPGRVRWANDYAIIRFHGYRSREEAERLNGLVLYVDERDLPELEEGEAYLYCEMGACLITEDGEPVGTVVGIIGSPAQPILQLEGPKGEVLFPLAPALVKEVREDGRLLIVTVPEGLIEVNQKSSSVDGAE